MIIFRGKKCFTNYLEFSQKKNSSTEINIEFQWNISENSNFLTDWNLLPVRKNLSKKQDSHI